MDFHHWMECLDLYMEETFGVTHLDIEDWDYRSAYEDGLTFREAAHRAIWSADA